MREHFVKNFKDKSGIAIMSVMLFFMVMMIFVGGLTIASQGNLNVSSVSADNTASYYAAEAGINYVVSDFKRIMDIEDGDLTQAQFIASIMNFVTNNQSKRVDLTDNNGTESYFVLRFTDVISNSTTRTFAFTIVSEGVVNGVSRTLETLVDLDYSLGAGDRKGFAVKHAILAENRITTDNNFTIGLTQNAINNAPPGTQPSVATYATASNSIFFKNASNYTGRVEVKAGTPNSVTNASPTQIDRTLNVQTFSPLNFDPIRTEAAQVIASPGNNANLGGLFSSATNNINNPASGTYTPAPGKYYVSSVVFGSNNVVINVPTAGTEVFIVTDNLVLGNVTTTGAGTVRFYVREGSNKFSFPTFNNAITGRQNAPHLFIVYVDTITSSTSLTVQNNAALYGSFMFKNASITFSNNTTFGGYLMTEGAALNLSNNGQITVALYYAPLGNVNLLNNGVVSGAIIGKNVDLANGATVRYEPAFLDNFPFDVESPIVSTTPSDGVRTLTFRIHRTTEQ